MHIFLPILAEGQGRNNYVMKGIFIFQRFLVHYRLGIFHALHKILGTVVCFGRKGPKNTYFLTEADPHFPHVVIKNLYLFPKKDTVVLQDILSPLIKYRPKIIIAESALWIISNYLFLLLRPFFGYKFISWSHGFNRKKGFHPESSFADRLRVWWMNKSDAVILYSRRGRSLVSPYLKNPAKVFVANNTLDTANLVNIRNRLRKRGKENIKRDIGFASQHNLIYVGRLLREKEPDRLIDILKGLLTQIEDVELHFVGAGPMLDELRNRAGEIDLKSKIRFWGPVTDDEEAGKMIYASDLMIIPGYVGLSIVHSFCFDCPVMTQKQGYKGPFHAPEIEYLIDGKTGFFVDYGNNQIMVRMIFEYLNDMKKQLEMKRNIEYMVKNTLSLSNMLRGFERAVDYCREVKG